MDRMVWCCFNEAKKDNKWMLLRRKSCDWRLEVVIFFRFYVVSLRAPIICFHSGGLMKNCRRIHRTCSLWTVACTKSRNFQTTFLNIGFGICLFLTPSTYHPQMGKNLCAGHQAPFHCKLVHTQNMLLTPSSSLSSSSSLSVAASAWSSMIEFFSFLFVCKQ